MVGMTSMASIHLRCKHCMIGITYVLQLVHCHTPDSAVAIQQLFLNHTNNHMTIT